MAEIRFNYGDKFTQTTDTNTGIGSTIPAAKLDVAGNTKAGSLRVSGIATLSSYQGFVNTKLSTTENLIVEAGQSGSVSGDVVIGTGQTISVSTGATTGQGGIQSLKVFETFMPPVGGTADRPTDVKPGMVYYNKDFKTIEFWDGNFWKQVDNTTRRGRGIYCGGFDGSSQVKNIDFIEMSTLGNARSFGELTVGREGCGRGTISSAIRGISMSGWDGSATPEIDYLTIASEGNSITFGSSSSQRGWGAGMSSSTRGLNAGGYTPSTVNVIDYVEINTLGDALDFGDLTTVKESTVGMASPTRGIIGPGMSPSFVSEIDFITMASKGNSIIFGDLNELRGLAAAANTVRGLFAGGKSNTQNLNLIYQITIASTGSQSEFGNLTSGRRKPDGVSNSTRACFAGGNLEPSGRINLIDFVTISSAGDAQDFGDLSLAREVGNCNSDSHGGLGGF